MITTKQIVEVGKSYLGSLAKAILKQWAAPVLAVPFVGSIANLAINKGVDALMNGLELAGYFVYVDIRTSAQGKAYFDAKIKGYEIEKNGTPEEKKAAEDEIKRTFEAFAKFNS